MSGSEMWKVSASVPIKNRMSRFLNYEDLCRKVEGLKDTYWSDTLHIRWGYMKHVVDELTAIAPETALELGTNGISLMDFSDCMDMDKSFIDPENAANKVFVLDATHTPWPIADKQYDVFVALQVMEHLSPAQSQVFSEIQRISRYAIISVPYRWNAPNNPSHHNIGDEMIRKWTNHYPPYKIISSGEGNNRRVAYCFNFETDVISLKVSYPVAIDFSQQLISRRFFASNKKELINEYFDNIYLITTSKGRESLNRMEQLLKDLNISVEIVEAPDGHSEPHLAEFLRFQNLPPGADRDTDRELMNHRRFLTSAEMWGRIKTFRFLMKDTMKMGYQRVLILEDQIIFAPGFHEKFRELTDQLKVVSWKILFLGADQHQWRIPFDLRYEDPDITEFDPSIPLYYPVDTVGTFALGIDASVAPDYICSLEQMRCDPGRALHPLFRRWYRHCFVAFPNLIEREQSDHKSEDMFL